MVILRVLWLLFQLLYVQEQKGIRHHYQQNFLLAKGMQFCQLCMKMFNHAWAIITISSAFAVPFRARPVHSLD